MVTLKLRYVSFSHMGGPDERCATVDEAQALAKRYSRGPIIIGEWSTPKDDLNFGQRVYWSAAKWWREGQDASNYLGKIVKILEKE
jgi:hypothetical protein